MKKLFFIWFLFSLAFSYAQKEKKSEVKFDDGIFKGSVNLNTNIFRKWYLQTGAEAMYNFDGGNMAIPMRFKYKINEKLNVFAGQLFYYTKNASYFNNFNQTPFFGTATQIGIEYNFTDQINIKIFYQYNFNSNKNFDSALLNMKSQLNFSFSYRF